MASPNEHEYTPNYPVKRRLSGQYKDTFAYVTVKDRMVKVLTGVIDTLNKQADLFKGEDQGERLEDLKAVISRLSQLHYEMQRDRDLVPLVWGADRKFWDEVYEVYMQKNNKPPSWFSSSWLYVECYMYRKVVDALKTSLFLRDFDPFKKQKEDSYYLYMEQVNSLASFLVALISNQLATLSLKDRKIEVMHMLLTSLWGNKTDLSMMATQSNYNASQNLTDLHKTGQARIDQMLHNVLCNQLEDLLEVLRDGPLEQVDVVLDNAGYELFTDCCLAEVLISLGYTKQVLFHCKQLPWFVSDASIADFHWLIDQLCKDSTDLDARDLGKKWRERLLDGSWRLTDHPFWTLPHEYAKMEGVSPDLYNDLKRSSLIIFKGDLNYRKLVADRNWPYTSPFREVLQGFSPSNICALRTLKADLVGGLPEGKAREAAEVNKDWLISGQFGIIQVYRK